MAVTIAVTTPTGNVGSHVVRMLCQAGVRPRLLLRNPDRLDADVRDRVDLAVGDQRDAEYVAEATRGVDAVFWVHPDDWSQPDPDADAERTGEGLAAAMRQNRIARVVFQSSIGAELRHGAGFIDGLARIEERLDAAREESGTALLHLRCGYFMTNLLCGARRAEGRAIDDHPAAGRADGVGRSTRHRHRGDGSPARGRLDRAGRYRRFTARPT